MREPVARNIVMAGAMINIDLQNREYSGRGMMGETTWAVVADKLSDFCQALTHLGFMLGENDETVAAIALTVDMSNVKMDNLGTDLIFY